MAQCKTAVTPLLTHWSYYSLALSHRFDVISWYWSLAGLMRFTLKNQWPCFLMHRCITTTSKSRNYFVLQVVTWAQAMPRPKVVPVNRPRRAVVAVAPRGSHIHRDQDSRWIEDLTHWGRDKIDVILQTLSNSFSLVKIYWFRLKFHWSLSSSPINNIPTLVQTMAWHQPGDKPISEPMIILLMHICLTRAQWVNSSLLSLTCWSLKKMTKISQTRQHFWIHIFNWKLYFDSNFTEVCYQGSIWQ